MVAMATADICDELYEEIVKHGAGVRILSPLPQFQSFGKRRSFSGCATTLKIFEDNSLLREALGEAGAGRVLIVDGGGSLRCALLGGNLAAMAAANGWAGIVINGCVRDVAEIDGCDVGVRALAAHPLKSFKRRQGERDVPVYFAGVCIRPGEWIFSDADGILVADASLAPVSS